MTDRTNCKKVAMLCAMECLLHMDMCDLLRKWAAQATAEGDLQTAAEISAAVLEHERFITDARAFAVALYMGRPPACDDDPAVDPSGPPSGAAPEGRS